MALEWIWFLGVFSNPGERESRDPRTPAGVVLFTELGVDDASVRGVLETPGVTTVNPDLMAPLRFLPREEDRPLASFDAFLVFPLLVDVLSFDFRESDIGILLVPGSGPTRLLLLRDLLLSPRVPFVLFLTGSS